MPEILLAEDNPADVYLIREALREHGVECNLQAVSDGSEVLRIVSEAGPTSKHWDLIILDLNLPRYDGIEILQEIRKSTAISDVPVIILTSADSPRDRELAISLGAAQFLRKPSSLDEFLALGQVFRSLLQKADSAGAP
jgi:two-component system, chemotaxis family, response regulator Rcp1